ncbi:hypothetical protein KPH14_006826 [Odynerus spinipes]|uniref:Uncharacterized protein n=1 Tax=Odynerus spinipes TaxID=1348599 RepID=A0AAD9VRQ2_9HYME|nr:hypothetical protein KPH14_006826 [Odynerus spinipes]
MDAHRKSRRRVFKRQRVLREIRITRSNQRFTDTNSTPGPNEHSYATRSKTLREVSSTSDKFDSLSSQSSDSSIIFLGSFRKIPQLIILDDSNDEQDDKDINYLKTWRTPKEEEVQILQECIDSSISQ